MATSLDSFLFGANAPYISELYARFLENPKSVDQTWVNFFTDLSDDLQIVLNEMGGASWASPVENIVVNTRFQIIFQSGRYVEFCDNLCVRNTFAHVHDTTKFPDECFFSVALV